MVQFIPASKLKTRYDILGHFYSIKISPTKIVSCRSVLEIVEKACSPAETSDLSRRTPDAVFIMMNPGSSRPLVEVNNQIHADAVDDLSISLVPTKPDTTQYQVMRVMHYCKWKHVRVLNLSDLRCSKSLEFFKRFKGLEREDLFDSHSIFSDRRMAELSVKLTNHKGIFVIRAWGVSAELDSLINRCTAKIPKSVKIKGLEKQGTTDKYLHPLPSLQKQKLAWVNRMVEQCLGKL